MICELVVRNRQRTRSLDLRLFRRIAVALLEEMLQVGQCDLAIHLLAAPEMTRLNRTFLQHDGSTDVITFDYGVRVPPSAGLAVHNPERGKTRPSNRAKAGLPVLQGELFICLEQAVLQSRRFRSTWQAELVRYQIHGVLHLCGYDDRQPADRRAMKREEDRLLRALSKRFTIANLANHGAPQRRLTSKSPAARAPSTFALRQPARKTKLAE